jgi:glycine/D-amino acid oxidase-like deaminating enzyme
MLTRRAWLRAAAAAAVAAFLPARARGAAPSAGAPAAGAPPASGTPAIGRRRLRVAVVGAGAFGGWTALHLRHRGATVTLVDAWGPGNSRSSSGGETRVIRAIYGPDRIYVDLAARSLVLWKENEKRFGRRLFHATGVLWMTGSDDAYERAALPILKEAGVRVDEMGAGDAARRWPQVRFDGVGRVLFEPGGGYLLARRACREVADRFVAEGGAYRQVAARPGPMRGGALDRLDLSDGSTLEADAFVFAGGPWLATLFPDLLGHRIRPSRQEVFYFGTPPGDPRFGDDRLPVWIDNGARLFYGVPGNEHRGFKIADDTRGPDFDPTAGDRVPTRSAMRAARAYLGRRFPDLADAPLLESRVCQYENSPDGHFIVDRHPEARNAWIVGGGSGHGFKHAPALGERVARLVTNEASPDPFFSLSRFRG